MAAMRKAAGIVLISLGVIALALYAIVMLRLPILLYWLRGLGISGFYVERVRTPISAVVSIVAGLLLLWRRSEPRAKIPPPQ